MYINELGLLVAGDEMPFEDVLLTIERDLGLNRHELMKAYFEEIQLI
ncbi:MAG: hypothetical protein H6502_03680 [Candidatus Woesearchaeota archaeon]|nr:MAG: hypothetical protein H6502_03680 [Candidatus Woesearchaeota archaeon]